MSENKPVRLLKRPRLLRWDDKTDKALESLRRRMEGEPSRSQAVSILIRRAAAQPLTEGTRP